MYSLFTQLGGEGTTECKFGTAEQSGRYLTKRLLFFRCGETTARITIHRSPSGADVYTTEIVTESQPLDVGQ